MYSFPNKLDVGDSVAFVFACWRLYKKSEMQKVRMRHSSPNVMFKAIMVLVSYFDDSDDSGVGS